MSWPTYGAPSGPRTTPVGTGWYGIGVPAGSARDPLGRGRLAEREDAERLDVALAAHAEQVVAARVGDEDLPAVGVDPVRVRVDLGARLVLVGVVVGLVGAEVGDLADAVAVDAVQRAEVRSRAAERSAHRRVGAEADGEVAGVPAERDVLRAGGAAAGVRAGLGACDGRPPTTSSLAPERTSTA